MKSSNARVIDEKEYYTCENSNISTHSKFKYVDTTITEYDPNGATLSVTYNDEKVEYTYNQFGNIEKETVFEKETVKKVMML